MSTTRTPSGKIITFYSYKGGTGRSMALANVACLLAQEGKNTKIIMIDWDLEAPGLHRYFQNNIDKQAGKSFSFGTSSGLIDLFYEMRRRCDEKKLVHDEIRDDFFDSIEIDNYLIKTNLNSLYLMTAGKLDENYASRVNSFNWQEFFSLYPSLIFKLAEYISTKFNYIFIDSRTGHTDISGICTALMPDKLVVVFTPNKQSISGVIDITRMAIEYRKQSDDLRKLLVFPLVSRVEPAEPKLREDWRFGNQSKNILGYQPEFENLFKDLYKLDECDLTPYFDDVQIQYIPRYAYGEEVAVLSERSEDRLSLARSYESFVKQLFKKDRPWDTFKQDEPIPTEGALEISDALKEAIGSLSKMGHYYQQTIPSKIEHSFIFETEALLNDLYIKSLQDPGAANITSSLLEALGQVGWLATAVKNQSIGADFVRKAKLLGRTLIIIGRMK